MAKPLDWDLLRSFLAVAPTGKLTAAERQLGVDNSTLSRRLTTLEAALGATFFEPRLSGYTLTHQGEHLLSQTETMESIALALAVHADAGRGRSHVSGTVRISVPDGFGSVILALAVKQLAQAMPRRPWHVGCLGRGPAAPALYLI
jgi:DNA-binding transcriptional LysR family regulator